MGRLALGVMGRCAPQTGPRRRPQAPVTGGLRSMAAGSCGTRVAPPHHPQRTPTHRPAPDRGAAPQGPACPQRAKSTEVGSRTHSQETRWTVCCDWRRGALRGRVARTRTRRTRRDSPRGGDTCVTNYSGEGAPRVGAGGAADASSRRGHGVRRARPTRAQTPSTITAREAHCRAPTPYRESLQCSRLLTGSTSSLWGAAGPCRAAPGSGARCRAGVRRQ